MKVGVNILNYGPAAGPGDFEAWVGHAERLGYHLAMISDHITLPPEVAAAYPPPFYDPFATLAWLAGRTATIELGTTVAVLPYRHPLHTARLAANIDVFSGGRLVLGVGIGWSPQEYAALGLDFAARGKIADDYLACIIDHWDHPVLTRHGRYVDAVDIATGPAPLRRPPVWVGGLDQPALRRAARFGDAWHPYGLGPEALRDRLPALRQAAEQAGRPVPAVAPRIALHITDKPIDRPDRLPGHGSLEQIHSDLAELAALGSTYVLLDPYLPVFLAGVPFADCPGHDPAQLEAIAERVVDLGAQRVR